MANYTVRVRDPVHGFIHLSSDELKLVESRAFRRLRNIKQLALTYLVYPGAMHTRFEHSLGVMELATRAFDFLAKKFNTELSNNFRKLELKLVEARTLLRVAALVHDIGHLPFSHSSEGILPKKPNGRANKHEDVSIAIVRGEEISRILKRHFYSEAVDHVCRLLDESADVPPELLILRKLLSGQFDADKMDYLSRDSLHCGVGYGNFDYLRLLETIRIKKSEQGGFELSVERGGLHTLEAMMLARYWMFTQVYFHKTRRIYDRYLSNYLQRWYSRQYADLQNVLNYDDISLMAGIVADSRTKTGDPERRRWAERIVNRKHHRVVYETTSHASPKDEKIALKVEGALKQRYPRTDFILDRAAGTIHNFYIEGVDESLGEEFPVFDTLTGRYLPLSKESRIFEKVPKPFRIIRIYGDVPKDGVPKYRDFARTKANIFEEEV